MDFETFLNCSQQELEEYRRSFRNRVSIKHVAIAGLQPSKKCQRHCPVVAEMDMLSTKEEPFDVSLPYDPIHRPLTRAQFAKLAGHMRFENIPELPPAGDYYGLGKLRSRIPKEGEPGAMVINYVREKKDP